MAEIDAYNEALQSGQYQKPRGLLGKYDNVRCLWEDEEVALYLKPFMEKMRARKRECGEGLRVLDMGCGSGDGLDLVCSVNESKFPYPGQDTGSQGDEVPWLFKGIDINDGLLRQAQALYGSRPNITFVRSDFNEFDLGAEEPYDLYLGSYGTLSHNTDEQTVDLLNRIARHSRNGAVIIVDWLGRYSYEWQTLWSENVKHNQWLDYAISYIYSNGEAQQQELTYFPLRVMGRREALDVYRRARKRAGGGIVLRRLADRSSFVGRHMDTAQYNPHCRPLRRAVNSLLEPGMCTNLDEALVRYVPRDGFATVNAYHHRLADCWNYLVTYTRALLEGGEIPAAPGEVPPPLRRTLTAMKNIVKVATRMRIGTPRASLVEPQLAYCLRELETGLQRGLGCGHGLVAIFEVVK